MRVFFDNIDENDPSEKTYLRIAKKAENFAESDPENCAFNCRKALDIYLNEKFKINRHDPKWKNVTWDELDRKRRNRKDNFNSLGELIGALPDCIPREIKEYCNYISEIGNHAVHYFGRVNFNETNSLIEKLNYILIPESFEKKENEYIFESNDDKNLMKQIEDGIANNELDTVKNNFVKLKLKKKDWDTPKFCDLAWETFKSEKTEIFNYFCEMGFDPEKPIKSYTKKYNTYITLEHPERWKSLDDKKKYSTLRAVLKYGQSEELKYILNSIEDNSSLLWDEQKIQSILHEYAADKNHGRVENIYKICVEKLGDINIQNEYKETALSYAVVKGNLEGVKILIQLGADPFIVDCAGRNCFADSIIYGQNEIFDYLLECFKDKFNPNWTEEITGNTYLMYCALTDNVDLFYKLWELGTDPIAENKGGLTILSFAAVWNADKLIDELYKLGKELKNEKVIVLGNTGPAIFSLFGTPNCEAEISCETLNKILELEPDLLKLKYSENEIQFSLFSFVAIYSNRIDILRFLYENYKFDIWEEPFNGIYLVQFCFARAKKEVIEFFMEVDPGLINDERVKDTLLFYSSMNHNLDFLQWVINEIDDNVCERVDDKTPIEAAIDNRCWENLPLLLVILNDEDLESAGKSILTQCVNNEADSTFIKNILAKGFDINRLEEINSINMNALGMAIRLGNLEQIEMILELGTDINAICIREPDEESDDFQELPPLAYSVRLNNTEIISKLLNVQGIDINKRCTFGYTAALLAVKEDNKEVLKLLISKGADLSIKNDEGINVLDLAIQKENLELIELILASDMSLLTKKNVVKIKKLQKNKIKALQESNKKLKKWKRL